MSETLDRRLTFEEWTKTLPSTHWARYDLGACRLGWEAALSACGVPRLQCELASSTGYAADVESGVCEDIKRRQQKGLAKYGTTVAANPLSQREWLTHAYEEALDLAIYLKRIIDGTQPHNAMLTDAGAEERKESRE